MGFQKFPSYRVSLMIDGLFDSVKSFFSVFFRVFDEVTELGFYGFDLKRWRFGSHA